MTKLLEKAVEAVRALSSAEQDEIARLILDLTSTQHPEPIDPAHMDAVLNGLAQAQNGEFASEEELRAALERFGT